jgi:superfamily II DNA or RNA helicase
MELREYQNRAIDQLRASLAAGNRRPVVQSPTGSGKTVIAAAIVNMARAKGKRVLFCVPAISLIDQTVDRFRQNGIFEIGVVQGQHEMTDYDQPVQVCSVQTLARRTIPGSDLVIIDECHAQFKLYDDWMNRPEWAKVPFIGLTATPWAKGMGAKGRWDDLIIGSTLQELIDLGHLSDFRVFAPAHPDLDGIKTVAGDYDLKGLGHAMDKSPLVADIVTTWLEQAQNRSTICFAVNRVHAKHIQTQFVSAGVAAEYMDAYTDLEERADIIKRFENGDVKVICNVGVLTTGFDADVRCIILARPTKSEILYVQMIGRGLRTAKGKLDCLILDHSDTTLRLGFVTDIQKTELHDGTKNQQAAERTAPLPKACPQCTFLKPAKMRKCPSCGFEPVSKVAEEVQEGELYELQRKGAAKKEQHSIEDKQRWYQQFVLHAELRGYKAGWAYWAYKDRFGVAPASMFQQKGASTIDWEVQNWITARNIRKAKSKQKVQFK